MIRSLPTSTAPVPLLLFSFARNRSRGHGSSWIQPKEPWLKGTSWNILTGNPWVLTIKFDGISG